VNRCSLIRGSTSEEATNDIISVQLPDIKRRVDSRQLHVDNIDVFCEQGVFDVEQTRRILTAGQQAGLAANFHGEELHCLHSAEVITFLKKFNSSLPTGSQEKQQLSVK